MCGLAGIVFWVNWKGGGCGVGVLKMEVVRSGPKGSEIGCEEEWVREAGLGQLGGLMR